MESAKLEKITVPAQSVEASAEDTVDRLKKHPCGSQLAWMLFRSMDEEKFLSFFDSLMPLNEGPIDHLLNETQCMGFLLRRFIDNDLSGRTLRHYSIFKETYEREPNLSGIAWILKEAKVQEIKERAAKRKADIQRIIDWFHDPFDKIATEIREACDQSVQTEDYSDDNEEELTDDQDSPVLYIFHPDAS